MSRPHGEAIESDSVLASLDAHAVRAERQRFAQELNAHADPLVALLRTIARMLRQSHPCDTRGPLTSALRLRVLVEQGAAELRALLGGRTPLEGGPLILGSQLAQDINRLIVAHVSGIPVNKHLGRIGGMPVRQEALLLRVARQALIDAARHAGAICIDVTLWDTGREVNLSIAVSGKQGTSRTDQRALWASLHDEALFLGGVVEAAPCRRVGGTYVLARMPSGLADNSLLPDESSSPTRSYVRDRSNRVGSRIDPARNAKCQNEDAK